MIKRIILENFKCFKKQSFNIDETVVLAGPNNSGKTTLLQAIAVWHFALNKWLMEKRSGAEKRTGVRITRQELFAIPIRKLNFLWSDTSTALKKGEGKPGAPRLMRITLEGDVMQDGKERPWDLTMEFRYSNPELLYAKPAKDPKGLEELVVHVPSFSGVNVEEPIHTPEYRNWLIGQGKPGDTLRNLLFDVSKEPEQWEKLNKEIRKIFRCHLLPPSYQGRPFILCEYLLGIPPKNGHGGLPKLEIATAGSGFLQTLMLLAFFYARRNVVAYLLDEPDAHLHTVLQGQMYDHFRKLAKEERCQLIVATHSEVLINRTDADKIVSFYGRPHKLLKDTQRDAMIEALKRLSSMDLALSEKKRVLYVESESDFNVLRSWAEVLDHPAFHEWFNQKDVYCYPMRGRNPREATAHFFALRALRDDMKGLIVLDKNSKETKQHGIKKPGLKIHTWKRYEIENYLIHPDAIERFIGARSIPLLGRKAIEEMRENLPPAVMNKPLDDHDYLEQTSASKKLLPLFMKSTGIKKKEYYQIAEQMLPDEIHPDIKKFFDILLKWFA